VSVTFRNATTDDVFYAFWNAASTSTVSVDMNGFVLTTNQGVAFIQAQL
jgi:hypothetical protein